MDKYILIEELIYLYLKNNISEYLYLRIKGDKMKFEIEASMCCAHIG